MSRNDSLGEFEQAVLLAIAHLRSDAAGAYGVTIRKEIERRTGRDIAIGALYTALDRLEAKGFVKSTMSDPTPERGGRSKRHFSLRTSGASALKQAHARFARMWDGLAPDLKRTRP